MSKTQRPNFWTTGRGILTIIAIAIAATAVVIFFVLSTLQNDDDFGQPAVYTDEPTDSVCDLGGVALQGSIADTPEAQWVDYHGVWLPTSSKYGPGNYAQNGEFSCFEHSPRGMLFAASAYTGQLTNPAYWQGHPAEFAGDHASAHQDEAEALFDEVFSDADSTLGGFRLVHYDGDTAQIDIAVTSFDGSETSRTSVVIDMVWDDGDWYIDASGEDLGITLEPIPDLIGYQQWNA